MKIINNNYGVAVSDLNKILDVIRKSDDLEELVAAYIVLRNFRKDIDTQSSLDEVRKRIELVNMQNQEKMQYVSNQRDIKIYSSAIEVKNDFSKRTTRRVYEEQKKILDDFLLGRKVDNSNYTYLSDEDMYVIITEFYKRNNDSLSLEIFNTLIGNRNILENGSNDSLGKSIFSLHLDFPYMKVMRKNNIFELITIVHEVAHIKYYVIALKNSTFSNFNDFHYNKQYIEAYPKYAERKFMEFLIGDKLLMSDLRRYLILTLDFQRKCLYSLLKNPNLSDLRDVNGQMGSDLLGNFDISDDVIAKSADRVLYDGLFSEQDKAKSPSNSVDLFKKM